MSEHEVFVSSARRASREHAVALRDALDTAGIDAFLDTDAIEDGDRFPARLVDGVLDARAFVLFADAVYFQRWYCIRELKLALAAYEEQVRRSADETARNEAVAGVVVAMSGGDLRNLPPRLASTQWPPAGETARLVGAVEAAMAKGPPTFRERAAGLGALRDHLLEEMAVPPPRNLGGETTLVPAGLDPSIGDKFVGRADDLWRLHMTLSTGRAEAAVAAALTASIEGGGGFGKTRLAREYLWRFADAYPGGWFWVDADVDDLLLEERHYDILKALDGGVPPLRTLRETETPVAPLLAAALRKIPPTEPALFIVDYVPEPTLGEPPPALRRWCPAPGFVTTVATSRWKASVALQEVATVELETLPPDAAVLMLRTETSTRLTDAEWRELADWVGHLPLALEVLNAALRHGAVGGDELLQAARTQGPAAGVDELAEALMGQVPAGALRGIRNALSLSFDKLTPQAQEGAGLLARLGPDPIPTALVKALGLTPKVPSELRARSIVSPVAEEDVELYGWMHRVMADFVAARTETDVGVIVEALTVVMTYEAGQDPASWPLTLGTVPHMVRAMNLIADSTPETEVDLRLRLGTLFWSAGSARRALVFNRAAVDLAETKLGKEHPRTLNSLNNLAATLRALGDAAGAREIYERVVEASQRVFGEEDPNTLRSLNNLAATLRALGDAAGPREIYERVVEVSQRVFGEEDPDTLRSLSNLAEALMASGEAARALEILGRVVEVSGRVLGEEHRSTLTSLNNLAEALRAVGDAVGAWEIHEWVVAVRRRVLGEEHPETLVSLDNLAGTMWAVGDAVAAQEVYERVVAVRRRVLGEEHPDTLTSLSNLATTISEQGDVATARSIEEEVLAIRGGVLGEHHPLTILTMRNLAVTLRDLGDHDAADGWDRRAAEAERERGT